MIERGTKLAIRKICKTKMTWVIFSHVYFNKHMRD